MSSENVREVLGRKRTVEVLEVLSGGGFQNYSEIESAIDTSSVTVSESLELLGSYGLLNRTEESKKDVRYEITEAGEEFLQLVHQLETLLAETADQ